MWYIGFKVFGRQCTVECRHNLFPEHNFLILCLIMPPPPNQRGGSGDILNCADPVGVGIHVTLFPFIIF